MKSANGRIKNIASHITGLLGVRVLALTLMLAQTLMITRVFGAEAFGKLSFALSVGSVATLIICFGLDNVLMRDLAKVGVNRIAKDPQWRPKLQFILGFSVAAQGVICGSFLAYLFHTDELPNYKLSLIIVFSLIPLQVIRRFFEMLLQGAKRTTYSMIGSQVAQPLLMIIGIGASIQLQTPKLIETLLAIYVVAIVGSSLLSLIIFRPTWRRIYPEKAEFSSTIDKKSLLSSGFNLSIVTLAFLIGQQIDSVLIGLLRGPSDVAEVKIALRVAELASTLRVVASLYYRPRVIEAHANSNTQLLQSLARQQVILFSTTGSLISISIWVWAESITGIFGAEFVEAANVTRIYMIGIFVTMLCGPANMILAFTGHERLASRILAISLVIQICLDLILIPHFGSMGCAIANAAGLTFFGIWSSIYSYRRTGVNPTILCITSGLFGRK